MPVSKTRLSATLKDEIDVLLDDAVPVREIPDRIGKRIAAGKLEGSAPSVRTVQRYVAERAERDKAPWSLALDRTGEAAAILDVIEAAIYATQGRVKTVTAAEAEMIGRIARATGYADSGLPAVDIWRLARLYVARRERGDGTEDLDAFLAFRPWKSQRDWDRYDRATINGIAPSLPKIVFDTLACGFNLGRLRGEETLMERDRIYRDGRSPVSNAVSSDERSTTGRDGS